MTAKPKLTRTIVEGLKPEPGKQYIVWDRLGGFGVVVSPGGSKRYICYGRVGGRGTAIKVTLGKHPLTTPESARTEAKEKLSMMEKGIDPRELRAKRDPVTFGELMEAYVELLESLGKFNAKNVKNSIHRHIKVHKILWRRSATDITLDDCVRIVGKVKDQGKLRQADLLRSYIKSAYSAAINARGDVNAPKAMRDLRININPAGELKKVKGSTGSRDRVLSDSELKNYWARVKALEEPKRSILMLHMLTGGQRQQQLVRVTTEDVDRDDNLMILRDPKGRREEARKHVVPLLSEAIQCIDRLTQVGSWIFSCNGGRSPVHVTYLHNAVKNISKVMGDSSELEKGEFTAGSIRATVETRLAARKVSSDVLAQLLSHGLGGIQNKHYQRHDYHEEKLEALHRLEWLLEGSPKDNVTPLRATR